MNTSSTELTGGNGRWRPLKKNSSNHHEIFYDFFQTYLSSLWLLLLRLEALFVIGGELDEELLLFQPVNCGVVDLCGSDDELGAPFK